MSEPKPKNVDSYIASSDTKAHSIMEHLREIITSTIPEAEEKISWNVPIYNYHGSILAGYSVAKHHVSFGIDALQEKDRKILKEKGYKTGKKTIQLQFDQKVPAKIIAEILKTQAKINETKKR